MKKITAGIIFGYFLQLTTASLAAQPSFPNHPLASTGSGGVQPNIMFTLDDSGSMLDDYLPDWAHFYKDRTTKLGYDTTTTSSPSLPSVALGQELFRNPEYNGLAYNPEVRYTPPSYVNTDGSRNTTKYPSMTGMSAGSGADESKSLPNWRSVPADGYGIQQLADASYVRNPAGASHYGGRDYTCPDGTFNRATCNLQAVDDNGKPFAYSYKFQPGEYCADKYLKTCTAQFGPSTAYPYPSKIRWCQGSNWGACQALFDDSGTLPGGTKYAYPRVAGDGGTGSRSNGSMKATGCDSQCEVTSVTINGTTYPLFGAVGTSNSELVARLATALPLGVPGASISNVNGDGFKLTIPVASDPAVSFTATGVRVASSEQWWSGWVGDYTPIGTNTKIEINPDIKKYAKSAVRTDCAAADYCTYAEEMTNYANWLAYYRTRLQMMKTAASNSFGEMDDHYRIGYFTISNSKFLNPQSFTQTAKKVWFDKLFGTDAPISNGTPLRGALSRVGQYYGGTHNGETWGEVTVTDPIQYSCQQNFNILATDGYWNTAGESDAYGPRTLDNASNVGEQDGGPGTGAGQEERPQYDGEYGVYTKTAKQFLATVTQVTATDTWFEKTTGSSLKQKFWNLVYDIKTYYTNKTVNYYTEIATPYTYSKYRQPWTYTQVRTDWTYTADDRKWYYSADRYNYTYTAVDTKFSWTKTTTPLTYTKTTYTGVPTTTYSYSVDGVLHTGESSCPRGASCTSTTVYKSYTSSSTEVSSCTASGNYGDASYTTCSGANAGTAKVKTGLDSCTPDATGNPRITCEKVLGNEKNTTSNLLSCTDGAIINSEYVRSCTQVKGGSYTVNNLTSCQVGTVNTSSKNTVTTACNETEVGVTQTTNLATCSTGVTTNTDHFVTRTCTKVEQTTTTKDLSTCTEGWSSNAYTACTKVYGSQTLDSSNLTSCSNSTVSGSPNVDYTCAKNYGTAVTYGPEATCPQHGGTNIDTQCKLTSNVTKLTSGVCTAGTTATEVTSCELKYDTAQDQSTCPATAVSSGSNAGDQVCTNPHYVAGNNNPYLVASCGTSVSGKFVGGTPTYDPNPGTRSTRSNDPVAYGACTGVPASTESATSCTEDTTSTPSITCTPVTLSSHPQYCNKGNFDLAAYTNASGTTVGAGRAKRECSTVKLKDNVPVASCPGASASWTTNTYDEASGATWTCTPYTLQTTGLRSCQEATSSDGNNFTTVTCSGTKAGGTQDTLADVADYYYRTDLRPAGGENCLAVSGENTDVDLCLNNVKASGKDKNPAQHMNTYTLGLGVSGQMLYSPTYESDTAGDYFDVAHGTEVKSGVCPWLSSGECNWPVPTAFTQTTVDDLWHAAVDGRGTYYSANNSAELSRSITGALAGISVNLGAGAAAGTSNLRPVSGDNYAYVASYTTVEWVGDLQARTIDLITLKVSSGLDAEGNSTCGIQDSGCPWSARAVLDVQNGVNGGKNASTTAPDAVSTEGVGRVLYLEPTSGNTMRPFNFAALTDTEKTYFTAGILNEPDLQGLVKGSSTALTVASSLVDYLAGDRSLEGNGFRPRKSVLGDIVNTSPVYVGKSPYKYTDTGYAAYSTKTAERERMVYIMANDGMLHAFDAINGHENWAFVPKTVLPQIYRLAKPGYSHQYYLDGVMTVGDAFFTGPGENEASWHTVLVAGYGKGGTGYVALDVTDPSKPPVYLWSVNANTTGFENLGYSFGNAAITKLPNGNWTVLFSSGYNNADGKGYLYAVNIASGEMMSGYPLATEPSGASNTNPSNLGKISTWADKPFTNNTTYFVYAGDFMGNVWRFDLGTTVKDLDPCTGVGSIHNCTTSKPVFKLAELKDADGTPQPITTRPELTTIDGMYRLVFVATGSYLTSTDSASTQKQTLYAIKDTLDNFADSNTAQSTYVNPRELQSVSTDKQTSDMFLPRYFVTDTVTIDKTAINTRVICAKSDCSTGAADMDWHKHHGWYVDLPETGERANVDMNLTLGTLTMVSNIPVASACETGGHGWVNYMDFKSGLPVASTLTGATTHMPMSSNAVANALVVGVNIIQASDGTLGGIVTTSDYRNVKVEPPYPPSKFKSKIDSWRELNPY